MIRGGRGHAMLEIQETLLALECDQPKVPGHDLDVLINIARRSSVTFVSPALHSARSSVDNCYRDQAVTNAAQLADLLSREDVPVLPPQA
jgi:hypothetical protein